MVVTVDIITLFPFNSQSCGCLYWNHRVYQVVQHRIVHQSSRQHMSRVFTLALTYLFVLISFQPCFSESELIVPLTVEEKKQQLRDLLYPNRHLQETDHGRMLFGQFLPNSAASCPNGPKLGVNTTAVTVPCVKCSNLDICNILNGFTVQEVYYPNNLDLRGTCTIIETLGLQMSLSLFGIGRTFRDTPQCRGYYFSLFIIDIVSFFNSFLVFQCKKHN